MLDMAVKARLPLVRVEADDPVNIGSVLSSITGVHPNKLTKVEPGGFAMLRKKLVKNAVYFLYGDPKTDPTDLYNMFAYSGATLIVVNCPEHPAYFEAGAVTAPASMIKGFVMKYAANDVTKIVDSLSGLSFKQAVEISKLAMTKKGEFSARAIQDVRRQFFGNVRGLELVGRCPPTYQPNPQLSTWIEENGVLVVKNVQPILKPRGLLFGGPPGTGKTEGAKYLADELDLPLYRLNLGILMSKWAGESEKNLDAALRQAENCSPCVLLLDEVEKLFTQDDDSGVITRLLATLLWWLQEHKHPVFTIMTTNNKGAIPPELVRPGRIDKKLMFPLMYPDAAEDFMNQLVLSLHDEYGLPVVQPPISKVTDLISHAEATALVLEAVKAAVLKTG